MFKVLPLPCSAVLLFCILPALAATTKTVLQIGVQSPPLLSGECFRRLSRTRKVCKDGCSGLTITLNGQRTFLSAFNIFFMTKLSPTSDHQVSKGFERRRLMFFTNVLMFRSIRTFVKNIRTFVLGIKRHAFFLGLTPHFWD